MMTMAAAGAAERAVVLRPVLNMHSKPSSDADVVSQAIYAMEVGVGKQEGAWVRILTPDGYPGWVEAAGLRPLSEGERYPASGKVAVVESLMAHLYRTKSVTRYAPVLTAPFESRLEVVLEDREEGGRWIQVRLPDGRRAWVQRGDVTLEPRVLDIAELIELSKRFLGLPYTWGGTSSFGYDCSGFTQMLCRRGGVAIPRDAKPQAHWDGMEKVEKADLRPGDLLYFGASVDKISHTGFYIGNGEFIHSTTHVRPVLQISRLDEEHWTKLFVCARRWKK
jgi:hypothetical protein